MNRPQPNSVTLQYNRPSFLASSLFFLLFSGPPKFRERDPTASLRGEIDLVVILHLVVWALAGLWVFYQMRFYCQANSKPLGLRLPQKLGLGLVAVLGASTFVSVAPALTAFKAYQMLVLLLFTTIFVERYGVGAFLTKLFQATAVLCTTIAIAAFAFPDLVMITTETGAARLRGDFIADTATVSLLCLVLLLARAQEISKVTYVLLLGLSCVLLVVSLSRTAYLALFVISTLTLLKRPNSKPFRRFASLYAATVAVFFALDLVSGLDRYRDPQSISTLSDRVGLWTYLSHITLQESPLFGLGYYSASRIYGPQYNVDLGTAHSMFFETFVGGGFPAITILVILCLVMSADATRLFHQDKSLGFTVTILFVATLILGFIGANIDSGPVAITFWSLAASLPVLRNRGSTSARASMTFDNTQIEVR